MGSTGSTGSLGTTARRATAAAAVLGLLALALAVALAIRTRAVPDSQDTTRPAHGAVVLLKGTPYFWVADEAGVLHWPSDTRALVGRYAKWDQVREVSLEQLQRLPRGDPWLPGPIAFVRAADQLYLVKWESGLTLPALLRVPSFEALKLFGITSSAVEERVADQETWERLIGMPIDELEAEFTPVADGAVSSWLGAAQGTWSGTGTQRNPELTYPVSIALSKATVHPALGVVVGTVNYPSFPCGGQLGLIAVTADEVRLAERLTSGLEGCTDQGRVTLARRSETRLFYLWTFPNDPMAVTGQLLLRSGTGSTGDSGVGR